jgi:pimeloyl-ACP methyl ester carboxylesterase
MATPAQIEFKTPTSGFVRAVAGGDGPALVALHRSIGGDGMAGFRATLMRQFSVVAPSLPGYDDSDTPDWARSPRDLAAVVMGALRPVMDERPVLVGLGLGGWVAAEMAAMCPERLRALVLVAPLGVQPHAGEITDPFLVSTEMYVELGFAQHEGHEAFANQFELGSDAWLRRERNREMTTRVAWRPRMFDATLPFRLPFVTTPTMLLWGEQDRIVPRGAIDRYVDAIPGAELVTLRECGHMAEVEASDRVAELISSFVAGHE